MIQLNVDYTLLNKFFGITASKIPAYANKDLEEILELEAQSGNTKAANYKQILSDPDKIYEIFKLSNVENKFIILQNMSEDDLDNLLPHLEQEQLAVGLNFFEEEKLLTLCQNLPIEPLINMILEKFELRDVLELMEEDSMDSFLKEPRAERKYAQKYFETLNTEDLERIMMYSFGPEFENKNRDEYLDHINNLNDQNFSNFLLSMEKKEKMNLIEGMATQNTDLLFLFENEDLIAPMNFLSKEDKVKMMGNLDTEFLIPMIQELPLDLTQIVLTQIDSRDFSEILARDFEEILSSVVLFSTKMG